MTGKEIQTAVIEKYGKQHQTFVAIEEMAELTKELTKNIRGNDNREGIIEEMADVYICLNQMQLIHGIGLNEIVEMMEKKFKRTEERLANG